MAAYNFSANSAFANAFNKRVGSYVQLAQVQPITDPRWQSQVADSGTVFSTGVREDGSDILWVSFAVLDGYNRPIEFKLDVPCCKSLNIKVGDTISKPQVVGLKPITNGPGKAPVTVAVVQALEPESLA